MNLPIDPDLRHDNFEAGLRWIHTGVSSAELDLLVEEAWRRFSESAGRHKISQTPVAAWHGAQRMAGCYFKLLSGNVATLGGARAAPGWEQAAVDLLHRQIELFSGLGLPQIQAIVRADDIATADLVRRAGMRLLTEIDHLWLDVLASYSLASNATEHASMVRSGTNSSQPSALCWQPARDFSHSTLAEFIGQTFTDTLDCPALDGRRTPQEVLDGFLDGRSLSDAGLQWEVLKADTASVGCLLLQTHHNGLMELAYMGLVPASRGRGFGRVMVARAIEAAHRRACSMLVVAVDRANWPALNVYRDWGFQSHRRLQVWVVPS